MKQYHQETGQARRNRRKNEQARLIARARRGDLFTDLAGASPVMGYYRNPRKGHKGAYATRMVWNLFSGYQWYERRITF